MITPLYTWPARLADKIYLQYQETAWAPGIAAAIGAGANQLELAFTAMLWLLSIDPITDDATSPLYGVGRGVQLDRIGRIVGQPRGSCTDAVYRYLLRARVLVNRSKGGPNTIIAVALAMFGGAGSPLLTPGWIASYAIDLVGVVLDPLAVDAAASLIGGATQGGTRSVLEYRVSAAASTLICDSFLAGQSCGDETDPTVGGACAGCVAAT